MSQEFGPLPHTGDVEKFLDPGFSLAQPWASGECKNTALHVIGDYVSSLYTNCKKIFFLRFFS